MYQKRLEESEVLLLQVKAGLKRLQENGSQFGVIGEEGRKEGIMLNFHNEKSISEAKLFPLVQRDR